MKILKMLAEIKIKDKFKLLLSNTYSWIMSMTFVKVTAIVVVNCFLLTAVYGQAAVMVADGARAATQFKQIFSDFELPYSYGKISSVNFKNSDKIVINIQDLHSHTGVQKNINNIIELFDNKYGVKNVYVEGAYGNVSTKWLTSVKNEELKDNIIEGLLDAGRLTGAEYYSAKSGKTEIIKGLESKKEYLDNLKRFGLIVTNQEILDIYFKEIDSSIKKLQNDYYNRQQKKIEQLSKDYVSGITTPKKYFTLMKKYADKLGVEISFYENLSLYIDLMEKQKSMDYEKITNELQVLVLRLKEVLPYGAYKMLLEGTKNFQQMDKLYGYIIKLSRKYNLEIAQNFPNLEKFFEYIELTQRINPLELITEEQNFKDEINDRFAVNRAEEEVIFLSNFVNYYKAYLSGKVTADDLQYYKNNIEKFKSLWVKYVDNRLVKALAEYEETADRFYEINLHRNDYFISNMNESLDGSEHLNSISGTTDLEKTMNSLSQAKELYFVVAGGFHTQAISELLSKHNITNIVITPNVQGDTKLAEETYYKIAKEQSKINFQALATWLITQEELENKNAFLNTIREAYPSIIKNASFSDMDVVQGLLQDLIDSKELELVSFNKDGYTVRYNGIEQTIPLIKGTADVDTNANDQLIEQAKKEVSVAEASLSDEDSISFYEDIANALNEEGITVNKKGIDIPYDFENIKEKCNVENLKNRNLSFSERLKLQIYFNGLFEGIKNSLKNNSIKAENKRSLSVLSKGQNQNREAIDDVFEKVNNSKYVSLEEFANAYGLDLNKLEDGLIDNFLKYQEKEYAEYNDNKPFEQWSNDSKNRSNIQIITALSMLEGDISVLAVGGGKSDAFKLAMTQRLIDYNKKGEAEENKAENGIIYTTSGEMLLDRDVNDFCEFLNNDNISSFLNSKKITKEVTYIENNKVKTYDFDNKKFIEQKDGNINSAFLSSKIIFAPINNVSYFDQYRLMNGEDSRKYSFFVDEIDFAFLNPLSFNLAISKDERENPNSNYNVVSRIYDEIEKEDGVIKIDGDRIVYNNNQIAKYDEKDSCVISESVNLDDLIKNLISDDMDFNQVKRNFKVNLKNALEVHKTYSVISVSEKGKNEYEHITVAKQFVAIDKTNNKILLEGKVGSQDEGVSLQEDLQAAIVAKIQRKNKGLDIDYNATATYSEGNIFSLFYSDMWDTLNNGKNAFVGATGTDNPMFQELEKETNVLPNKFTAQEDLVSHLFGNELYYDKNYAESIVYSDIRNAYLNKNYDELKNIIDETDDQTKKDEAILAALKVYDVGISKDDINVVYDLVGMLSPKGKYKQKHNSIIQKIDEIRKENKTDPAIFVSVKNIGEANLLKDSILEKDTEAKVLVIDGDSDISLNDSKTQREIESGKYKAVIVTQLIERGENLSDTEINKIVMHTYPVDSVTYTQRQGRTSRKANADFKEVSVIYSSILEMIDLSYAGDISNSSEIIPVLIKHAKEVDDAEKIEEDANKVDTLKTKVSGTDSFKNIVNVEFVNQKNNILIHKDRAIGDNLADTMNIMYNTLLDNSTLSVRQQMETEKREKEIVDDLFKSDITVEVKQILKENGLDLDNLNKEQVQTVKNYLENNKVLSAEEIYELSNTEVVSIFLNSIIMQAKQQANMDRIENKKDYNNSLNVFLSSDYVNKLLSLISINRNSMGLENSYELGRQAKRNSILYSVDNIARQFKLTDISIDKNQFEKESLKTKALKLFGNLLKYSPIVVSILSAALLSSGFILGGLTVSLTAAFLPTIGLIFAGFLALYFMKEKFWDKISYFVSETDRNNIIAFKETGNTEYLPSAISSAINMGLSYMMPVGLAGGFIALLTGVLMANPLFITISAVTIGLALLTTSVFILKNKKTLEKQQTINVDADQKGISNFVTGVVFTGIIAIAATLVSTVGLPVAVVAGIIAEVAFLLIKYGVKRNQGERFMKLRGLKFASVGILATVSFGLVLLSGSAALVVAPVAAALIPGYFVMVLLAFKKYQNIKKEASDAVRKKDIILDFLKIGTPVIFSFSAVAIILSSIGIVAVAPANIVLIVLSVAAAILLNNSKFVEKHPRISRLAVAMVTFVLIGSSSIKGVAGAENSTETLEVSQDDNLQVSQQETKSDNEATPLESAKKNVDKVGEKNVDKLGEKITENEQEKGDVVDTADDTVSKAVSEYSQDMSKTSSEKISSEKDEGKAAKDATVAGLSNATGGFRGGVLEGVSDATNSIATDGTAIMDGNKDVLMQTEQKSKSDDQNNNINDVINNLNNKGYESSFSSETGLITVKKGNVKLDFYAYDKKAVGEYAYKTELIKEENIEGTFNLYEKLNSNNNYKVSNKINDDGSFTVTSKDGKFSFKVSPFNEKGEIKNNNAINKEQKNVNNIIESYENFKSNGIKVSDYKDGKFTISKNGLTMDAYVDKDGKINDKNLKNINNTFDTQKYLNSKTVKNVFDDVTYNKDKGYFTVKDGNFQVNIYSADDKFNKEGLEGFVNDYNKLKKNGEKNNYEVTGYDGKKDKFTVTIKTKKGNKVEMDAYMNSKNFNQGKINELCKGYGDLVDKYGAENVKYGKDRKGNAIFIINGKTVYPFDKDGNWQLDENGNYKGGNNNGGGDSGSYFFGGGYSPNGQYDGGVFGLSSSGVESNVNDREFISQKQSDNSLYGETRSIFSFIEEVINYLKDGINNMLAYFFGDESAEYQLGNQKPVQVIDDVLFNFVNSSDKLGEEAEKFGVKSEYFTDLQVSTVYLTDDKEKEPIKVYYDEKDKPTDGSKAISYDEYKNNESKYKVSEYQTKDGEYTWKRAQNENDKDMLICYDKDGNKVALLNEEPISVSNENTQYAFYDLTEPTVNVDEIMQGNASNNAIPSAYIGKDGSTISFQGYKNEENGEVVLASPEEDAPLTSAMFDFRSGEWIYRTEDFDAVIQDFADNFPDQQTKDLVNDNVAMFRENKDFGGRQDGKFVVNKTTFEFIKTFLTTIKYDDNGDPLAYVEKDGKIEVVPVRNGISEEELGGKFLGWRMEGTDILKQAGANLRIEEDNENVDENTIPSKNHTAMNQLKILLSLYGDLTPEEIDTLNHMYSCVELEGTNDVPKGTMRNWNIPYQQYGLESDHIRQLYLLLYQSNESANALINLDTTAQNGISDTEIMGSDDIDDVVGLIKEQLDVEKSFVQSVLDFKIEFLGFTIKGTDLLRIEAGIDINENVFKEPGAFISNENWVKIRHLILTKDGINWIGAQSDESKISRESAVGPDKYLVETAHSKIIAGGFYFVPVIVGFALYKLGRKLKRSLKRIKNFLLRKGEPEPEPEHSFDVSVDFDGVKLSFNKVGKAKQGIFADIDNLPFEEKTDIKTKINSIPNEIFENIGVTKEQLAKEAETNGAYTSKALKNLLREKVNQKQFANLKESLNKNKNKKIDSGLKFIDSLIAEGLLTDNEYTALIKRMFKVGAINVADLQNFLDESKEIAELTEKEVTEKLVSNFDELTEKLVGGMVDSKFDKLSDYLPDELKNAVDERGRSIQGKVKKALTDKFSEQLLNNPKLLKTDKNNTYQIFSGDNIDKIGSAISRRTLDEEILNALFVQAPSQTGGLSIISDLDTASIYIQRQILNDIYSGKYKNKKDLEEKNKERIEDIVAFNKHLGTSCELLKKNSSTNNDRATQTNGEEYYSDDSHNLLFGLLNISKTASEAGIEDINIFALSQELADKYFMEVYSVLEQNNSIETNKYDGTINLVASINNFLDNADKQEEKQDSLYRKFGRAINKDIRNIMLEINPEQKESVQDFAKRSLLDKQKAQVVKQLSKIDLSKIKVKESEKENSELYKLLGKDVNEDSINFYIYGNNNKNVDNVDLQELRDRIEQLQTAIEQDFSNGYLLDLGNITYIIEQFNDLKTNFTRSTRVTLRNYIDGIYVRFFKKMFGFSFWNITTKEQKLTFLLLTAGFVALAAGSFLFTPLGMAWLTSIGLGFITSSSIAVAFGTIATDVAMSFLMAGILLPKMIVGKTDDSGMKKSIIKMASIFSVYYGGFLGAFFVRGLSVALFSLTPFGVVTILISLGVWVAIGLPTFSAFWQLMVGIKSNRVERKEKQLEAQKETEKRLSYQRWGFVVSASGILSLLGLYFWGGLGLALTTLPLFAIAAIVVGVGLILYGTVKHIGDFNKPAQAHKFFKQNLEQVYRESSDKFKFLTDFQVTVENAYRKGAISTENREAMLAWVYNKANDAEIASEYERMLKEKALKTLGKEKLDQYTQEYIDENNLFNVESKQWRDYFTKLFEQMIAGNEFSFNSVFDMPSVGLNIQAYGESIIYTKDNILNKDDVDDFHKGVTQFTQTVTREGNEAAWKNTCEKFDKIDLKKLNDTERGKIESFIKDLKNLKATDKAKLKDYDELGLTSSESINVYNEVIGACISFMEEVSGSQTSSLEIAGSYIFDYHEEYARLKGDYRYYSIIRNLSVDYSSIEKANDEIKKNEMAKDNKKESELIKELEQKNENGETLTDEQYFVLRYSQYNPEVENRYTAVITDASIWDQYDQIKEVENIVKTLSIEDLRYSTRDELWEKIEKNNKVTSEQKEAFYALRPHTLNLIVACNEYGVAYNLVNPKDTVPGLDRNKNGQMATTKRLFTDKDVVLCLDAFTGENYWAKPPQSILYSAKEFLSTGAFTTNLAMRTKNISDTVLSEAYGFGQRDWTSYVQKIYPGRTYYGKGFTLPGMAITNSRLHTAEDSWAFYFVKYISDLGSKFSKEKINVFSEHSGSMILEWVRQTGIFTYLTEARYAMNSTTLLTKDFSMLYDSNSVGWDFKLSNLFMISHYTNSILTVTFILGLPLAVIFSSFAFLMPFLISFAISTMLMFAINLTKLNTDARERGDFIVAIKDNISDLFSKFPFWVTLQPMLLIFSAKSSNGLFEFIHSVKEKVLHPKSFDEMYENFGKYTVQFGIAAYVLSALYVFLILAFTFSNPLTFGVGFVAAIWGLAQALVVALPYIFAGNAFIGAYAAYSVNFEDGEVSDRDVWSSVYKKGLSNIYMAPFILYRFFKDLSAILKGEQPKNINRIVKLNGKYTTSAKQIEKATTVERLNELLEKGESENEVLKAIADNNEIRKELQEAINGSQEDKNKVFVKIADILNEKVEKGEIDPYEFIEKEETDIDKKVIDEEMRDLFIPRYDVYFIKGYKSFLNSISNFIFKYPILKAVVIPVAKGFFVAGASSVVLTAILSFTGVAYLVTPVMLAIFLFAAGIPALNNIGTSFAKKDNSKSLTALFYLTSLSIIPIISYFYQKRKINKVEEQLKQTFVELEKDKNFRKEIENKVKTENYTLKDAFMEALLSEEKNIKASLSDLYNAIENKPSSVIDSKLIDYFGDSFINLRKSILNDENLKKLEQKAEPVRELPAGSIDKSFASQANKQIKQETAEKTEVFTPTIIDEEKEIETKKGEITSVEEKQPVVIDVKGKVISDVDKEKDLTPVEKKGIAKTEETETEIIIGKDKYTVIDEEDKQIMPSGFLAVLYKYFNDFEAYFNKLVENFFRKEKKQQSEIEEPAKVESQKMIETKGAKEEKEEKTKDKSEEKEVVSTQAIKTLEESNLEENVKKETYKKDYLEKGEVISETKDYLSEKDTEQKEQEVEVTEEKVESKKEQKAEERVEESVQEEIEEQKQAKETVTEIDEEEEKINFAQLFELLENTLKNTVNPTAVASAVSEIVSNATAGEVEVKTLRKFEFAEKADRRRRIQISRGSNVYIQANDIKFGVVLQEVNSGNYDLLITVLNESEKKFNELEQRDKDLLIKTVQAEYLDRLSYDSPLRTKLLGKVYGKDSNLIDNLPKLQKKLKEDIEKLTEEFEEDYEMYRIFEQIADSKTRPSALRHAEFKVTKGMTTQAMINELYKIKEQGISTIYITRGKDVDASVVNNLLKLTTSNNMALNANVDINIHSDADMDLLNNISGISGIRFSNVQNVKDIEKIENVVNSVDNKIYNTAFPSISYSLVKENSKGEVYSEDQLPIDVVENIINKIEERKLKGEFVVAYSTYNNLAEKIKEKLNNENRLIIEANTDEYNKLYGLLRDGIAIIYKSVNRTIQSNVEKKYARGIEIGSKGFENFDTKFSEIYNMINDKNFDIDNISQSKLLSEKGQFAIKYILEQDLEDSEKIEMVKALLDGMLVASIEENINVDKGISNNLKDVLDVLSPKDRKQFRTALINVSKNNNIDGINNAIMKQIDEINKTYGNMNAADAQRELKESLVAETNEEAQIAKMLKLFDIICSERNAGNIGEKAFDTSLEGIRDILTAA